MDGLCIVTIAVKQTHDDIGAVYLCVNVQRSVHAFGAVLRSSPFVLNQLPCSLPVCGILVIPFDDIGHALVVGTLLRNGLYTLAHDFLDVLLYERQRIHGGYIHSAIPSVAMTHHVSDAV